MRIRDWTADVCSSDLAFLRRAAHRGVEFLARADDMVGDRDRGLGIAEQGFEALLAFEIAELGERFAIGFEQVEGEEEQLGPLVLCAMATLQARQSVV